MTAQTLNIGPATHSWYHTRYTKDKFKVQKFRENKSSREEAGNEGAIQMTLKEAKLERAQIEWKKWPKMKHSERWFSSSLNYFHYTVNWKGTKLYLSIS